jgi:hypothetical protein
MMACFHTAPLLRSILSFDFCGQRGVKASKIHRRMLAQYRENCIMQRKVYQLVERFQSDRTSITDEDCLGHPTTSQTVDNAE